MAPIRLLYRAEWDALPTKWTDIIRLPVANVFCGPTNRERCFSIRACIKEMKYLQGRHMSVKGCPDIKYSFVIGCCGTVYEGRGWLRSPGLPITYSAMNRTSLYIALAGKFDNQSAPIPPAMLDSLENLIKMGIDFKYIDPNYTAYDL